MPVGDRRCELCRYWEFQAPGENGIDRGECRRNPPNVLTLQGQGLARGQVAVQFQAYFPPAASSSWCGAFEAEPSSSPAYRL